MTDSIDKGIDEGFRFYADFTGGDGRRDQPHDGPDSGPIPDTLIFTEGNIMELPAPANDQPWWKDPERCLERVADENPRTYPDGNPKTLMGAKKPDITVVPPIAILHLSTGMMNGEIKYGPFNWRDQGISTRPYIAAAIRHLLAYLDGEDYSADTVEAGAPVHHLGHVMACCAILLDAESIGKLNDNRPKPGKTGEAIERYVTEKQLSTTSTA